MIFSKSFGYALRGILYVAVMSEENRKIPIKEIASHLSVPRHFLGKIMNKVVKKGILVSTKGPGGGFEIKTSNLNISVLSIVEAIDGLQNFHGCVLGLWNCSPQNPCPLDALLLSQKTEMLQLFSATSVGSFLKEDNAKLIASISQ